MSDPETWRDLGEILYWNMGLDERGEMEHCCPVEDACETHRALAAEDE